MTTDGTTTSNGAPGINLHALTTLIFDLDGVIWRGSEPIEGAAASIARLREAGKRCLYCTNNSKATQRQFAEKLRGMGIELEEDDVISSSGATAMYLSAQFTGPFLVYVIGEEGIISALQKIGAHVVSDNDVTDDTMVDCVVVGIDRTFDYNKLRIAQRLIHKGANFIATNRDNTFPTESGIVPGAGSIVSSVEAASGVTPVTIGKPRPAMVHLVMDKLGVAPHEVAMIGDRLDTDIACARRAGIAALFVATGVTPMPQARRGKGELRADAFFEDLPALCDAILTDVQHLAPPVAAQTEPVAQGTPSGLQNAVATPEIAPLQLAALQATVPVTAALEVLAPRDAPAEPEAAASTTELLEPPPSPVADWSVAAILDEDEAPAAVAAFEDAPVAPGIDNLDEPISFDHGPVDDETLVLSDEPLAVADEPFTLDDEPLAVSDEPLAVADEAFMLDDEPLTLDDEPIDDGLFAFDDAATPGMAQANLPTATAGTSDGEKWDESWFDGEGDAESDAESQALVPTVVPTADAFDLLDFDLTTPGGAPNEAATAAGESNAGVQDEAVSDVSVETPSAFEAAAPAPDSDNNDESEDDGFNWKLD